MMCHMCSKKMIRLTVAYTVAWVEYTCLTACDWLFLSFYFVIFLFLLDLSALLLRCWSTGMRGQGFRATSVSWPLYFNTLTGRILNFQLWTSCICGEVVKTMMIKLMGSLSRAGSYMSFSKWSTWYYNKGLWRFDETVSSGDMPVATSGSALSFFPGISSPNNCLFAF